MPVLYLGIDTHEFKLGANRAAADMNAVAKAADRANASAEDFGKAIGSAAKQVAGLLAGLKAIEGMKGFVQRGVEMNSFLEQSRIGIATLITSMVKLQNEQGRLLEGTEKYVAAQGIAADMMKEIQRLGMETTATTQELVEGVQLIIGPAVQAGMALKDIPKFAVAGAQAMQTLGVPLIQMRTELDALLTGRVNLGQDLLAPKLFADIPSAQLGEYLRGLQEAGTLLDEIGRRLEPFRIAGQDVADMWKGLTSNLSEAMDILAGQSAFGLTESLKESVRELQNLFLTVEKGADGKSVTKISEDFENIARVLNEIESAFGDAILSGAKTFVELAKDANAALKNFDVDAGLDTLADAIMGVATAYGSMKLARSIATKAQGEGLLADMQSQGMFQALKEKITSYDVALQETIATRQKATSEELAAAQASLTRLEREKALVLSQERYAQTIATKLAGTQNEARAEQNLTTIRARRIAVDNQLTAAETRVATATTAATAAARGATVAEAALSGLKTAASGLLSLFGGPLGAAFTAATTGLTYLMTKESEAEKYAIRHADALRSVSENLEDATESARRYAEELSKMSQDQLKFEQVAAKNSIQKIIGDYISVRGAVSDYFLSFTSGMEEIKRVGELTKPLENVAEMTAEELKVLRDKIRDYATATNQTEEYKKSTEELLNPLIAAKQREEQITEALNGKIETQKKENAVVREAGTYLKEYAAASEAGAKASADLDEAIRAVELGKMPQTLAEAVAWLDKYTANTVLAAEEHKALEESTAAATLTMLQEAEALARLSGDMERAAEVAALIVKFQQRLASGVQASGTSRSSSISSGFDDARRKAEEAARALEDLEDKIAQLTKTDAQYRELKLTKEIEKLKKDYPQLTAAINKFEAAQRAAWEKDDVLKAQERARANLQEQLAFYEELSELSGEYNRTTDIRNRLLREEAKRYRSVEGIASDLVDEWERLQRLEISTDPFDGAYRGLLKFSSEMADSGRQWESITHGFASDFESASRSMFDDFLSTGKASFDDLGDLFKQLLADMAYQAAIRPIAVNVVQGVTTALFGSGASGLTGGAGPAGLVGGTSGGLGLNNLGGLTNLMPSSWSSGLFTGISNTINNTMASWFPGTFAPAGSIAGTVMTPVVGTSSSAGLAAAEAGLLGGNAGGGLVSSGGTFLQAATPYLGAFSYGSLGYSMLGGALGLPQSKYSGITAGIGSTLGYAGGAALGATIGGTLGSVVPIVGTALGALAGGALGSLFGSKRKTHPSVYGNMIDAGITRDVEAYIDNFMAGVGYDRAGKSEAEPIAQAMAEIAATHADKILTVAEAMPEVYQDALLAELEEADWTAGRKKPGSTSAWNFQWWKEGMLEDDIKGAAEDIYRAMGQAAQEAFDNIDTSQIFDSLELTSEEGINRAYMAAQSVAAIADAIDEINDPTSQIVTAAEAASAQMDALAQSVASYGVNAEYAAGLVGEYREAYLTSYVTALEEMFNPLSQIEQQAKGYKTAIDDYSEALTILGASEEQLAQVRGYTQSAINTVMGTLEDTYNPLNNLDKQLNAVNEAFDDNISALRMLGATQEEVTRAEQMRIQALEQTMQELTRSTRQSFELRTLALEYGSGSYEYGMGSMQIEHANELLNLADQFGEDSELFDTALKIQEAEQTKYRIDALESQLQAALAAEAQAAQTRAQANLNAAQAAYDATQERIRALEDELAAAEQAQRDAIQAAIDAHQDRLNELEDELSRAIQAQQDLVGSLEDELSRALQAQQDKVAGLEQELAAAEQAQRDAVQSAIEAHQDRLNELENELSRALQAQQDLVSKLETEYAAAVQAQQDKVAGLESELEAALAAQIQAVNDQTQDAERLRDTFLSLLDALREARRDLWTSEQDNLVGTSFQESLNAFEAAYQKGMAGDTDALAELSSLAFDALAQARNNLGSNQEYNSLFYDIDQKLKAAEELSAQQVDEQEAHLAALEKELLTLQEMSGQEEEIHRDILDIQADLDRERAILEAHLDTSEDSHRRLNDIRKDLDRERAILENQLDVEEDSYRTFEEIRSDIANEQELLDEQIALLATLEEDEQITHRSIEEIKADLETERAILEAHLDTSEESHRSIEEIKADLETERAILEEQLGTAEESHRTFEEIRADIEYEQTLLDEQLAKMDALNAVEEITYRSIEEIRTDLENELALLQTQAAEVTRQSNLLQQMHTTAVSSGTNVAAIRSELASLKSSLTTMVSEIKESSKATTSSSSSSSSSSSTSSSGSSSSSASGTSSSTSGETTVESGTGIYGSKYKTENELLVAKTRSVNLSNHDGKNTWTVSDTRNAIKDAGLTVEEWYNKFGKAEGFAAGGLTPRNTPFWVGESGPELMMSSQQWGVLSNTDSMRLFDYAPRMPDIGVGLDLQPVVGELREMKGYLKQIIIKTDKTAYGIEKVLSYCRRWDAEGMPTAATV